MWVTRPSKAEKERHAHEIDERHAARVATMRDAERTFVPTGRAPKLVCSICARGPLDGLGIFRGRDAKLYCEAHLDPKNKRRTPRVAKRTWREDEE